MTNADELSPEANVPGRLPRVVVYTDAGTKLAFDHDEVRAMRVAVEARAQAKSLSLAAYLAAFVPRYLLPDESERTCVALVRAIFDDFHPKKGC